MTANTVEVDGLAKTYPGGVEAVKGITFQVAPGEVFGLLGPNGAGKSTTIGILTTTISPTAGSARLAGFDVARQPLEARSVWSVVFQEPVVDRGLSGRANLRLHADLWGLDPAAARERIDELAGLLDLDQLLDRPGPSHSGGTPGSRATAAASAGAWRSRGRSCRAPGCCSSASRRSGSTHGSAWSCSRRSPPCAAARG